MATTTIVHGRRRPTEAPASRGVESGRLPRGLDNRSLRRRRLQVAVVLVIVGLVGACAPGLGEVRERMEGAQPSWLGVAVVLELLSCPSYVLMVRPIFCARMSWRTSYQLGMSELAVGSLAPASGAAGLAFGAWVLRKRGMPVTDIARRSVAFFVLKMVALQLVVGRRRIWLPARWRRLQLASPSREKLLTLLLRRIRWLERFSRPRVGWLFDHVATGSVFGLFVFGLFVFGLTLSAFFAPPFSGLDTLPSLGVVVMGLGVLMRDVVLATVGAVVGAVGVATVLALGNLVVKVAEHVI
jgi:hypothetical protein